AIPCAFIGGVEVVGDAGAWCRTGSAGDGNDGDADDSAAGRRIRLMRRWVELVRALFEIETGGRRGVEVHHAHFLYAEAQLGVGGLVPDGDDNGGGGSAVGSSGEAATIGAAGESDRLP